MLAVNFVRHRTYWWRGHCDDGVVTGDKIEAG